MSDEAWLIGRKVDVPKKYFCGNKDLSIRFELFIGGQSQNKEGLNSFKLLVFLSLLAVFFLSEMDHCTRVVIYFAAGLLVQTVNSKTSPKESGPIPNNSV